MLLVARRANTSTAMTRAIDPLKPKEEKSLADMVEAEIDFWKELKHGVDRTTSKPPEPSEDPDAEEIDGSAG